MLSHKSNSISVLLNTENKHCREISADDISVQSDLPTVMISDLFLFV